MYDVDQAMTSVGRRCKDANVQTKWYAIEVCVCEGKKMSSDAT
jgi:hypothetical protein